MSISTVKGASSLVVDEFCERASTVKSIESPSYTFCTGAWKVNVTTSCEPDATETSASTG